MVRSLKKKMVNQTLGFCAGLAIATVTEPCWAIDYQPFDFVPAAPGTMMMMGYYEFENRNEYTTTTGTSITHDTGLTSQIGLARYLYYNQFNGTPFLLEWLQPFYVGGHWVPEMISRAGGIDVLGRAKTPSHRVTLEEIAHAAPEVLFIAPCGYNAEQARQEYLSMNFPEEWKSIPAVRDGRVFALDANSYVSRPSGRLVTGIEAMAKALHPSLQARAKVESALLSIGEPARNSRSASAGSSGD